MQCFSDKEIKEDLEAVADVAFPDKYRRILSRFSLEEEQRSSQ
jgi:hypothetical protein